jgi:hypothetical protein
MYHIPVMHVGDSPWPPRPIVLWFSDSHVLDIGTQEQEVLGKARQDEMIRNKRGLVIPAFNPSIWEAKVSLGRKEGRERKKKRGRKREKRASSTPKRCLCQVKAGPVLGNTRSARI